MAKIYSRTAVSYFCENVFIYVYMLSLQRMYCMKGFLLVMLAIFLTLPSRAIDVPTVPLLLTPSSNQTDYDDGLFIWKNSTDSNGQGVVYDLYLGTGNNPVLFQGELTDGYTDDKMLAFIDGETFNVYLFNPLHGGQTYYWKVVARSSDGTQSQSVIQSFTTSSSNHFSPTEPINPTPPLSASGVSHQPLLLWSASTDADGDAIVYHIYLDTLASPKKLLASNLSSPAFKPMTPLKDNKKYYWKVAADDGKGRQTESAVWNFTTGNYAPSIPILKFPADEAAGIPYTSALEWFAASDPDDDFSHYEVWYGKDASLGQVKVSNTTKAYIALNAGSQYFWKVVAIDKHHTKSESQTRSFTTAAVSNIPPTAPVLASPLDKATSVSTEVKLAWMPSLDPDGHPLRYTLFTGETPTQLKQYASVVDTSYVLSNLLPDKTYYWQVQASDAHGGTVASQIFSFKTTADDIGIVLMKSYYRFAHATMLYQFIESSLTPSFHPDTIVYESRGRTTMNDATALVFYYDNAATKISFELPASFSVTSSITYNYGLPTNATVIYQIEGDFSVHNQVTVVLRAGDAVKRYTIDLRVNELPDKPILQSPAEGGSDVSVLPIFSWAGGDDPEGQPLIYRLYLGTEASNLVQQGLTSNVKNFQYRGKPLLNGVKYYWKIVAQDAANETRESDLYSFVTERKGNIRTTPELLFPRTISTYVDLNVDLYWSNISDDYVSSDIYLGTGEQPAKWQEHVTGDHYALENLTPNTTYYWKIINHRKDGSSVESEVRKFKTRPASGNVTGILTDSRDGQRYQWVQLGGMQWMVHNLAYQPEAADGFAGYVYNNIDNGQKTYFMLDHLLENYNKHGYIYNAAGATNMASGKESIQGVCPTGWRLPTRQEWMDAFYTLGGVSGDEMVGNNTIDYDGWPVSGKENIWENIYGLSILPSGGMTGGVINRIFWSQFWMQDSASEKMQYVQYYYNQASKKLTISEADDYLNKSGAYVRCVRSLNMAPQSITLTAPANNTTLSEYSVTLDWQAGIDPEHDLLTYRVYIDTAQIPLKVAADTLTKTSVTIEGLSQGVTYYWRVAARDANGNIAASEVWSFTTGANTVNAAPHVPVLLLPAANQSGVVISPAFEWSTMQDPENNVVKADLYLGIDSLTWSPIARSLAASTYTLHKKLISETTYFWQVKVYDGNGGVAYSKVSVFKTGNQGPTIPQLLTPANGALHVLNIHTLSWAFATDPEGDHVTYTVRIGQSASSLQEAATNLSGNSYSFGNLSTPLNTDFYWQVIAVDSKGASTASEVRSFKTYRYYDVNGTTLKTPADRTIGASLTPTLSWNAGPYANTRYDVYLQKDNGLMLVAANLNATTYTVSQLLGKNSLEPHTTYSWQVVGKDAGGNGNAAPSAIWSFTTTSDPPSKPLLELPANHAVSQPYSVLLTWQASTGLAGDYIFYDVYLREDGAADVKIAADVLATTYQTPDLTLKPDTKYYWHVVAKNMFAGQAASDTWDFAVKDNTINTPPTQPALKTPVNYTHDVSLTPILTWEASQDVDGDPVKYSIYMGKDPATMSLLKSGVTQLSHTVVAPLMPHTYYYWQVKVSDSKAQTSSETGVFVTVNSDPDKVTLISPQPQEQLLNNHAVLTWLPAADADNDEVEYDIYLGSEPSVLQKVAANIDGVQYELKNLINNKNYYWQVVAHDAFGGESRSDVQQFISKNEAPGIVSLNTPSDQATVKGPAVTLQWMPAVDPENGPVVYDVYIGIDGAPHARVATVLDGSAFILHSLTGGTNYTWHVKARDAWGGESLSEVWSFTCQPGTADQPPGQVLLTAPANQAQHLADPIVLSWAPSQDPEGEKVVYNIYLGRDPNSLPLVAVKLDGTAYSISGLQSDTNYYWKVEAADPAANSTFSVTWQFSTIRKFEVAGSIKDGMDNPVSGIMVEVGDQVAQTNIDGRYNIEVSQGWSGTIRPTSQIYRFSPVETEITALDNNSLENNFLALRSGYILIQGIITDESGNGIEGVRLQGMDSDVVTDATGSYIVEVPAGWTGTFTPASPGYTFIPQARSFEHVENDQGNQDFVGAVVLDVSLPENQLVKVYPNPSQGPLVFTWQTALASEGTLVFINAFGQEVSRTRIAKHTKHFNFNANHKTPGGIYQCILYCDDRVVFVTRVVFLD
jgi:uncharacterized protein (TIGR02145 family)